jgi:hypothetical protein
MAICAPSGDQTGTPPTPIARQFRTSDAGVTSAPDGVTSLMPPHPARNAILFPSGDQAGDHPCARSTGRPSDPDRAGRR